MGKVYLQIHKILNLLINSEINMKSRILFSITILYVTLISSAIAQIIAERKYDPNEIVLSALGTAVRAKYGSNYEISFHIMDSLIANSLPGEITDPYGTLAGRVLFSAWDKSQEEKRTMDSVVTGMYKNGQIIWDDYPGTKSGFASELITTKDINNDGEVDILEAETDFTRNTRESSISYLWILSWNGTTGKIINDINPITNQSILVSTDGWYDLVDINRDGIVEIRGEIDHWQEDFPNLNPPTLPSITYSWNGSKYGFFFSAHQISENEFYPADLMGVLLHSSVTKNNNQYVYNYSVINLPTSKQSIEDVYVGGLEDTSSNYAPTGWHASSSSYINGRYFYNSTYQLRGAISPGHSLSGFGTVSLSRPAIVKYYVQGYRHYGQTATDEEYRNDIYTNSVSGYTLGTSDTAQEFVPINFLDTLTGYTTQSRSLGWIKDQPTADKYLGYFSSAKTNLQQNNIGSTRTTLQRLLQDINIDSTANFTSEAYALIRYNTEYLLAQLPVPPPGCIVKLINSTGTKLIGGALQYYEGSWKDAVNNNDGTFFVNTAKTTLSLRMTYEYGTQTKSNVSVGTDTIAFQTVNAQIQLQNSNGVLIDTGSVQYYAGAWRILGTTINGTATKELLPANYSFRMTFAYASKDKQQDIGTNAIVIFQTVNAAVQLQNSQGTLMDQGTVQYYSGAWRDLGTTTNGVANKELLPNNYSFRMTYAYASKDKQQDIGTNPIVIFQTVNAAVQLQNSQGSLVDQGTVQYYSGAWRDFRTTTNGVATKELLPNNYSFRMTYAYASKDKQQDISTNATVVFQTVNAAVQLQNSQGVLMPAPLGDQGTVQYYSGAWRDLGTTLNGVAKKELLPNNYSFRMTYEYVSLDKAQDISTNNTVSFSTVLCTIQVKNSQNQLVNNALASYYSGAWRQIGNTVNGEVTKELLPVNLSFRVKYGTQQQDKQQNLSTNNVVEFGIQ
jgi:hypothetical protein